MKCEYCGNEIPVNAEKCPSCGAACMAQNVNVQQQVAGPEIPVQKPQLSWWGKIWSQPRMARRDYWIIILILFLLDGIGSATVVLPIFLTILEIEIGIHRLHDANHSAWHLLWILTLIGAIVPFIMMLQKGTDGPNQYGDVPQRIF